jgi:PAS domain S-box-containing protein
MSRWLSKSFRKDLLLSQSGLTPKHTILIILACTFIALVVALAWFSLNRVQARIKTDVAEALEIVLQTTRESLNMWVENGKFQLKQLAGEPRLASMVERQLEVPRNKTDLLKSRGLRRLREFFLQNKDRFGQAGFFIISPDFVNIALIGDKNIGSKNRIASQALDLLNRAFQGETVLVPPMWSDVELISSSGNNVGTAPTMFFVAPIKNDRGEIIAAVARQIDPSQDFTRLIQLGRIGKSGETYAFGRYGKLLSQSRFDEDLRKAGLLGKGEKSILSVSVRDPGGDLTKGFSPSVPRYQQPLTLMAQQATKGKPGLNVAGYRGYRGVPVYGAWLWDDKLGVGLATEIDAADALGPYYTTRTVILTVLGITVLLALGSLVFAVLIDVRANRALQKSHDELEHRVAERTTELKENQARLEQAEERSRLLLESADEGIFGVAEDGLVNFINPAGLAMLGFEADELIGQKIHPLIHHTRPDGTPYPVEECPMHHSLTQGTIGNQDDEVLWRKDGSSFHVEYTSVPIRKNDSIAGTVVVFRDISERKEAEQALRESRASARGLLDATQESLLLLDKEGTIIASNQTAAQRFKKSSDELRGTSLFSLWPQNILESRRAHFEKVLQTGNPADFEDIRDGMVFHHIYYPVQDKAGAIMGVAIFAQDITERKRAEDAIRESQERLRISQQTLKIALESSNTGVWTFDPQTNETTFQSEQWYKQIGYQRDEFKADQDPFADLLHPDDKAATFKAIEDHLEGVTKTYEKEFRLKSKDGTWRWILSKGQITKRDSDGKATEMTGVHLDITERRHMEDELRQKVDELQRFSKVAFGREKKMIQLKQEINELGGQRGQGEKYKIVK